MPKPAAEKMNARIEAALNARDIAALRAAVADGCPVGGENSMGRTALGECVAHDKGEAARFLFLEAGANVNEADRRGWTPAFWAVHMLDEALLSLFLPAIDFGALNGSEQSLLGFAAAYGWARGVDILLQSAPKIGEQTGLDAMGSAIMGGKHDCADALACWAREQPKPPARQKKAREKLEKWLEIAQAASEANPKHYPRWRAAQEALALREAIESGERAQKDKPKASVAPAKAIRL